MKNIIFLVAFLPSLCFCEGPLFHHQEPEKQQEFENVYKDLRHLGLIKIIQMKQFTVISSSVCHTDGVSWTPTNLTGSVTITSGNTVIVLVSGSLKTSDSASVAARSTIYRGSTDLGNSTNGMNYINGNFAGSSEVPASPMAWDTNFTSGSNTYTVRIRGDGAGTVTWNSQNQLSTMTIIEVSGI